jgi:hypothetical protein
VPHVPGKPPLEVNRGGWPPLAKGRKVGLRDFGVLSVEVDDLIADPLRPSRLEPAAAALRECLAILEERDLAAAE